MTNESLISPERIKPLTLRRNIAWSLGGHLLYAGCQWGLLMVLAKFGSVTLLGQFVFTLAVTTPVMQLASLGLRAIVATDAKREHEFGHFIALSIVTTLLGLLVISGIAIFVPACQEIFLAIVVMGFVRALEMFSEVIYGVLQLNERMDRIAMLQSLNSITALVAITTVMSFSHNLLYVVLALLASRLLWLLVGDLPSAAWVRQQRGACRPSWDLWALRNLAWLALPFGMAVFLTNLQLNIPRYYIVDYLDERSLGIFAGIAYIILAGSVVNGAVTHSTMPRLAQYFVLRNTSAFAQLFAKTVGIGLVIGIGAMLVIAVAGRPLLALLYTAEFAEHTQLFRYLSWAFALQMVTGTLTSAVRAMCAFRIIFWNSVVNTGLLVGLCAVFIPQYGLHGAAWALIMKEGFAVIAYGGAIYFLLQEARRVTEVEGYCSGRLAEK